MIEINKITELDDKRHIALYDVDKLRNFIYPRRSDKLADPGNAAVPF